MCPCEWTEAAVGGHSLSGGTGTVVRLSRRHDDTTGRLKDTLLQRGQSAVTSLSSEPLFPIASDCKTLPLCTTVCSICEMSRRVSDLIRGRLNVFMFPTDSRAFDWTLLVLVFSLHLKHGCGSFGLMFMIHLNCFQQLKSFIFLYFNVIQDCREYPIKKFRSTYKSIKPSNV